jgi:hypothetical protein
VPRSSWLGGRFSEEHRSGNPQDAGEPVEEGSGRSLEAPLDLGKIILGHSRQACDDRLCLVACLPVKANTFADGNVGQAGHNLSLGQ